jgi:hypothetical protein
LSLIFLAGFLITTPSLSPAADSTPPNAMEVGVAQVDITPDYPVRLHGFGGRRAESEGVTQRIWAKALAIGDPQLGPAVLITADNLGVSDEITRTIAERLAGKVGLKRERLSITASHSHTAPMLKGVAPTIFGTEIPSEHQAHIDRYTREFTDKLEQAALAAIRDIRPGRLFWGMGLAKFAINRRTAGGPVDHDLPVLVVRDPGEQVRAIYFSYACHCVTLSHNKISGDWLGYALEQVQAKFPGAVALASVGCGADSNPRSGVTGAKVEIASEQGQQIATEVARLLNGRLTLLTNRPQTRLARIELPFAPARTRAEWEARARSKDAVGHQARVSLARLDQGQSLPTQIDYPVQTWLFGDQLAMVFLPGEVVVDYSLRLKRELARERIWVNAYANDSPCYIPSERVLQEGGYEGGDAMIYYDQPQKLAPGLEQKIVDAVRAQIPKSYVKSAAASPASVAQQGAPRDPVALARYLLDAANSTRAREAALRTNLQFAAELITEMTRALQPGTPTEYERIPWIWRVAIACGQSNQPMQIKRVLAVSLPEEGTPLRDWQAVVVGGGIINGLTQRGQWPAQTIESILANDSVLARRWQRALDLASAMTDDAKVPSGTRYDALRMLGMESWEKRGAQVVRYLAKGTHGELQMGAVSALGDMPSPQAATALIAALEHLKGTNRELALDALLRDEPRIGALLDASKARGYQPENLGTNRVAKLRDHPNPALRARARELFPP